MKTEKKAKKCVRITLELPNSFVGLLSAKAGLSRWKDKAMGDAGERSHFDAGDIVAWLVMLEARGVTEEEIHVLTPMMWRDSEGPVLIHEERRVYQDGVQISPAPKELV